MKKKERRYSKRLAVHINIKVFRLDKKTMRTVRAYLLDARDMTKEGVFLRGNAAFPLDTRLRLEFNLPGGDTPVVADARVAWQAKPSHPGYYPGMGVSIQGSEEVTERDCGIFYGCVCVTTGMPLSLRICICSLKIWGPGYMSWSGLICRRNTSERSLSALLLKLTVLLILSTKRCGR